MFEPKHYLTGDDGYVNPGETFWLHRARLDGTVNTPQGPKPQAKLEVSRTEDGERELVFTGGAGIVNQISRMAPGDLPAEVRLDEVPSGKGNPTRILTPASQPAPTGARDSMDSTPAQF